ncbi:MAG: S8 family serine peptidase [Clostridia bacterium]|nr:S8 family serine peptidase [Clostridia bacterium]
MKLKGFLNLIAAVAVCAVLEVSAFATDYIFKIDSDAAMLCDEEASLMTEECFDEDKAIAKNHGIFKTDDMAVIEKYMEMGLIEYYEEDAPAYLFDMPNTSEYMTIDSGTSSSTVPLGKSYNLLNVQSLWSLGFTGKGVVVGVIDSGVYPNADIAGNILSGENVSPDVDTDSSKRYITLDGHGHGTCVSGIIAANGDHYRGIAFEAKIVPLKAFTDSGVGNVSNLVKGIYRAIDVYGCDVINMSCGAAKDSSKSLLAAVNYASSKGVQIIAAAGNNGSQSNTLDADYYPASYDATISVANITADGMHWSSSQENAGVDISAQGRMVYCLKNSDTGYRYNSGTSFAAPMVTGVAALILGYKPDTTPAEMKSLICDTATDLGITGWDMSYGNGKVNCAGIAQRLLDGTLYRSNIVEYKGTYNYAIRNGLSTPYSAFLAFAKYSGNRMVGIETRSISLESGKSTIMSTDKGSSIIKLFELNKASLGVLSGITIGK